MRDNFDTCDVMSSRVKHLDSEVWRLKSIGSEMKELKGLLRKVLRRLPEEEHSVVYISDDDKMMEGSKPAGQQVAGVNAGSFPASAHDILLFPTNSIFPTHRKMYEPKATGLKGARISDDDKMMEGSKPAGHQVAGVNAGSFPAPAHDILLFPTHRKMYKPNATGLKGARISDDDKMMEGSKPAGQVAGVNAGSFPASAHDNLLFPTHRKMYEPKASGLKGARLIVRPYNGVTEDEIHYDDPFIHTSAVANNSEAAPVVTVDYVPIITKSVTHTKASPLFAENDESAGPSHIDPQLTNLPNVSATISPVQSRRQSPAPYPIGSPPPFVFKAPNHHDGLSHLSTANLVLDDSPPPNPPSPYVLPNMRSFDTTEFTLPPPSKMAPPSTFQSGTNADELPAVNLQPPTPQADREVNDAVPQTHIIRPRPIRQRMPEESSETADDAQDDSNPSPADLAVPSDSLHPPGEVRMTRSRAHSGGPPSPAGKRKADDADTGRAIKRRK
jgi:hypothetical protein